MPPVQLPLLHSVSFRMGNHKKTLENLDVASKQQKLLNGGHSKHQNGSAIKERDACTSTSTSTSTPFIINELAVHH